MSFSYEEIFKDLKNTPIDFFKILNLDTKATTEQIEEAYNLQKKKAEFIQELEKKNLLLQKIEEAYNFLKNENLRIHYSILINQKELSTTLLEIEHNERLHLIDEVEELNINKKKHRDIVILVFVMSVILTAIITFCLTIYNIESYKHGYEQDFVIQEEIQSNTVTENIISIPPQPKPSKGIFDKLLYSSSVAPFKIEVPDYNEDYFIILKKTTSEEYIKIYIPSGETFETTVPLGEYELKYCCGKEWYGEKDVFGSNTQFYKTDDIFDFYIANNAYSGYTVELIKQINGNLSETSIDRSEFFN